MIIMTETILINKKPSAFSHVNKKNTTSIAQQCYVPLKHLKLLVNVFISIMDLGYSITFGYTTTFWNLKENRISLNYPMAPEDEKR